MIEIDVKNALTDRAVQRVIQLVGNHPVHILSANQKTLTKFKKYRKYKQTEIWYCTGSDKTKKRMKNVTNACKAGFDGISLPFRNMNTETINLVKSYGLKIGGYGISTDVDVERWVNAGCIRFNMINKVFE